MNDQLFSVKGKVVAVTGAGGVLCGELARGLAAQGAKVAVLDIMEPAAGAVAKSINDAGGTSIAVKCDVLTKESVQKAHDEIVAKLGPVDVLINGAGGNKAQATTSDTLSFFDMPVDAVKWVFDLNFMGTLLPCQVFGKAMAQRKQGNIINISSMNYFRPLTRVPAYSAAKAAISNFTQWLAVHMSQNYGTDIRVNAIAPGFFMTEQNRFLLTDKETGKLTPRGQTIINHTPMARYGQPSDLVGTIVWLVSDASKFVHGTTIAIDGGFSAFSGV
jgi:NAD(P)-dependent dehydrogenase (short-subunit alcohol dehydrogenase family)